MNFENIKEIIENRRSEKGISQRELAKLSGIGRSTYNDLVNGKIKKIDVESLKKIAEILELSLAKLLKVAGYDDFLTFLSTDPYKNKSSEDLKSLIDEYKKTQLDLLDFDSNKRKKTNSARNTLFTTIEHLKIMKSSKDSLYTIDRAIEDIENAFNELKEVQEKYDYTKLPKDN